MATNERILFVTGRLAEPPLRRLLERLSRDVGFDYEVAVLGISVAALMHADLVVRKLGALPAGRPVDRILLPGWCQGDLDPLASHFGTLVERGPKLMLDLPTFFGAEGRDPVVLDEFDIEIIAEINHAPRLSDEEILSLAQQYRGDGADVIDLGAVPGERWSRAGEVTRWLVEEGFRVSIDSFDRDEVTASVEAGAELVLSCNGSNREWACELEAELVAIPDDRDLESLVATIEFLETRGARFRLDPVLEPVGFGFAASLERFFAARERWPAAEIMMGVGNLTELCEVDSAGVNFILAAVCQELGVRSVLTTEVINWCRSSVRELDLARRLVRHSVLNRVLPKHLDSSLVMLRDPDRAELGDEALDQLAGQLTDPNFRIHVDGGTLHVMNRDGHWQGTDPYELFDRVLAESAAAQPDRLSRTHAFYLGHELAKASTALVLGKRYVQDEPLDWGFLTRAEPSAHDRRRADAEGDGSRE